MTHSSHVLLTKFFVVVFVLVKIIDGFFNFKIHRSSYLRCSNMTENSFQHCKFSRFALGFWICPSWFCICDCWKLNKVKATVPTVELFHFKFLLSPPHSSHLFGSHMVKVMCNQSLCVCSNFWVYYVNGWSVNVNCSPPFFDGKRTLWGCTLVAVYGVKVNWKLVLQTSLLQALNAWTIINLCLAAQLWIA